MEKHIIFGVHVSDRIHHAPDIQKLLSEYGCNIRTRIGLHEVKEDFCSPNGVIVRGQAEMLRAVRKIK